MSAEIPNIEKIVADYLRTEGHRVVAETPQDKSTPWVLLTLLAAPTLTSRDYFFRGMIDLACYAGKQGGQPEAVALAAAVRAMIDVIDEASHTGAVITASKNIGFLRSPDTSLDGRQRVIVTQYVYFHPS